MNKRLYVLLLLASTCGLAPAARGGSTPTNSLRSSISSAINSQDQDQLRSLLGQGAARSLDWTHPDASGSQSLLRSAWLASTPIKTLVLNWSQANGKLRDWLTVQDGADSLLILAAQQFDASAYNAYIAPNVGQADAASLDQGMSYGLKISNCDYLLALSQTIGTSQAGDALLRRKTAAGLTISFASYACGPQVLNNLFIGKSAELAALLTNTDIHGQNALTRAIENGDGALAVYLLQTLQVPAVITNPYYSDARALSLLYGNATVLSLLIPGYLGTTTLKTWVSDVATQNAACAKDFGHGSAAGFSTRGPGGTTLIGCVHPQLIGSVQVPAAGDGTALAAACAAYGLQPFYKAFPVPSGFTTCAEAK